MTSRGDYRLRTRSRRANATNQGFIALRAGQVSIAEFLSALVDRATAQPRLPPLEAATIKALSRGSAKLLPINLPPLDEQRRIAEVLRSVDEAIAANECCNARHVCSEGARTRFLQVDFKLKPLIGEMPAIMDDSYACKSDLP